MTATVLVTGGLGYIGSHTVVALMSRGYEPVILDNLANSSEAVLDRLGAICGRKPVFIRGDIRDRDLLDRIFREQSPTSVIHFAGLKAVGESVAEPLRYYDNNVSGSCTLLAAMATADINRIIFSSSATVYGDPEHNPIDETAATGAVNPYGRSKLMVEEILRDEQAARPALGAIALRYFNPVGAHESGLIGEDPRETPNNLMPFVTQVAVGRQERLRVFGGDWPTRDGTGVRDYIHVMDLAEGHVAALDYLSGASGFQTINLGTGNGYSVLELVAAFERASGQTIPYDIVPRRAGDVAECYADPGLAARLLDWRASRELQQMCDDAWRWQSNNPDGYPD
jgi:UDP-glucose 4-epimerase